MNNVLYNRYAETGRIEWVLKYGRFIDPEHAEAWDGLMTPKGDGLILRKILTEFKFVSTRDAIWLPSNPFLPVVSYHNRYYEGVFYPMLFSSAYCNEFVSAHSPTLPDISKREVAITAEPRKPRLAFG